ncbi:hypothetical protein J2Z19_000093 [Ensifer adhaerens]|uniref:Uncharacterized protein n=1 Tax=Ensifer adhaerens TaxID=106592 RepID=A0ACC5SND9_ENSAD|nr:hypothetical protein [Ensifer adhaerens]MBP1870396.1 hypothetical protein [Ensifer adhaerens]
MQIYGFFSNAGATRATTTGSPAATDAAALEQKNGSPLLNLLRADEETTASRKAVAKKKLDELKEQLRMLRFWASDPETLARLAKQLAQQLGAAAQQFAGGGSTGMTGGGSDATATTAAMAAMQASTAEAANAGGEESNDHDKPQPSSFVERAYREFSSDGSQDSSDARTIAEFKALAEQLKQVLRKAEQDLRAKGAGNDADDARKASNTLATSMASLDAAGTAGATASAVTIPTSVSI